MDKRQLQHMVQLDANESVQRFPSQCHIYVWLQICCVPVALLSFVTAMSVLWFLLLSSSSELWLSFGLHSVRLRLLPTHTDTTAQELRPSTTASEVRVMLVMADNREVSSSMTDALSLAVYVNYQYTRLHAGMGFRYVQHFLNQTVAGNSKERPSCYNSILKQYRAASWCKLQSVYQLMSTESHYDWMMFMDSDAVVNNLHLPVEGYLALVDTGPNGFCTAARFLDHNSTCTALFASDEPWGNDSPNGGMWIIKRTELGKQLISTWWHINNSEWNFRFPLYEQHTLSKLMFKRHRGLKEGEKGDEQIVGQHVVEVYGRQLNELVGVIDEPTMVGVTQTRLQYVRHQYNGQANDRVPFFQQRVNLIQSDRLHFQRRGIDTNFTAVIETIISQHMTRLALDADHIPPPDPPSLNKSSADVGSTE